jgi:hypothetical protein
MYGARTIMLFMPRIMPASRSGSTLNALYGTTGRSHVADAAILCGRTNRDVAPARLYRPLNRG